MTKTKIAPITVGVDSGTIEISSAGDLEAAGKVYSHGQELSCWTADAIWDGQKGGVKTPQGDGDHTVTLKVFKEQKLMEKYQNRGTLDSDFPRFTTLAWGRPGAKPYPGFIMSVGDCGRVSGTIEIPAHRGLMVAWINHFDLEIHVLL